MSQKHESWVRYINSRMTLTKTVDDSRFMNQISGRLIKCLYLLPELEQELFLTGNRNLTIEIVGNPKLPFGMKTRSSGQKVSRNYTISICEECGEWPEDRFLGAFLRELGHVVAEIPPEDEWPIVRGERARFKESVELMADCMVWKWGLRHYNVSYLSATFPSHWVDRIVSDIEKLLETDERFG